MYGVDVEKHGTQVNFKGFELPERQAPSGILVRPVPPPDTSIGAAETLPGKRLNIRIIAPSEPIKYSFFISLNKVNILIIRLMLPHKFNFV